MIKNKVPRIILLTLFLVVLQGQQYMALGSIYVGSLDNAKIKRLTTDYDNWAEYDIDWQPGGDLLSVVRGRIFSSNGGHLVVLSSGDTLRTIYRDDGKIGEPEWSPDGKLIAYTKENNYSDVLYVVDISNGKRKRISRRGDSVSSFTWDQDSSSLLYISYYFSIKRAWLTGRKKTILSSLKGYLEVWASNNGNMAVLRENAVTLYRSNGHPLWQLLKTSNKIVEAKWSPDTKWLAYTQESDKYGDTLYVVRKDGKRRLRLGMRSNEVDSFDWTDDSKSVVYTNLDGGWSVDIDSRIRNRIPGVSDGDLIAVSSVGKKIAFSK